MNKRIAIINKKGKPWTTSVGWFTDELAAQRCCDRVNKRHSDVHYVVVKENENEREQNISVL